MAKEVIIVGAGLGGLSTALRLSYHGYSITLLESYHQAGGRLNQIKDKGYTFDMGPSFFSMSYEFEELFKSSGMKNPLKLEPLDPLYTVYFEHLQKPFHIYKDAKKLAQEFQAIEPSFLSQMEKYLHKAKTIFNDTEYRIVKRNYNGWIDHYLAMAQVPWKHAPMMFRSMWKELCNHFDSEEVKVIFSLVAFFLGATPFDTPAVYSLLTYTELQNDGYWNVKGGMYEIVEAIVAELKNRGVNLIMNTKVVEVKSSGRKVTEVIDQSGKSWKADIFVINADAAGFRSKILKRKKFEEAKLDRLHWTLAPFTIYLGIEGKIPQLEQHNYFLGNNFKDYSKMIFRTSVAPSKPYYYVNVSSKNNPSCAPEGCENIFILCPVPDLRFKSNWNDADQLASTIIDDLGKRISFDWKGKIAVKHILTPKDWENQLSLYKGSGLGLAHDLNQIGGLRPSNTDEEFGNLFYVGASTVPGTGLPIVVISSKLVTERILNV